MKWYRKLHRRSIKELTEKIDKANSKDLEAAIYRILWGELDFPYDITQGRLENLNKAFSRKWYPRICKLLEDNGIVKRRGFLPYYKFTEYGKSYIMMRYML
jgi:hypothetical protein